MTLPAPYYKDGNVTIHHGDALDVLAEMAPDSVQCCVTSPPYWGLRRYKGAQERTWADGITCAYGHEPTVGLYVAHTVEVLRAIKRVLREDGLCFINLGDSFFSGGRNPTLSHGRQHEAACGTDDKAPQCYLPPDCACPYRHDAPPSENQFHHQRTWNSDQPASQSPPPGQVVSHDSERLDCAEASPGASPVGVQASKLPDVSLSLREYPPDQGNSDCPSKHATSSPESQVCAYTMGDPVESQIGVSSKTGQHYGTHGNGATDGASVYHSRDRASDCASCPYSSMASHHRQERLKPKDLCLIPQRVAIAAQDDGWYVRSIIIWAKTAPMPESVKDRPTIAHEYILLLAKRPNYFYDAEAVREPAVSDHGSGNGYKRAARVSYQNPDGSPRGSDKPWRGSSFSGSRDLAVHPNVGQGERTERPGRHLRSVWTLGQEPFRDWAGVEHFAVFPSELPRRCIMASTSEAGNCSTCGKPWPREIAVHYIKNRPSAGDDPRSRNEDRLAKSRELFGSQGWRGNNLLRDAESLGFHPACTCECSCEPALVLDPFAGTGTTGAVAKSLGRRAVLIDRAEAYCAMAARRVQAVSMPMRMETGS